MQPRVAEGRDPRSVIAFSETCGAQREFQEVTDNFFGYAVLATTSPAAMASPVVS